MPDLLRGHFTSGVGILGLQRGHFLVHFIYGLRKTTMYGYNSIEAGSYFAMRSEAESSGGRSIMEIPFGPSIKYFTGPLHDRLSFQVKEMNWKILS